MEPVPESSWDNRLTWSYKDMLHYFFANVMLRGSVRRDVLVPDLTISADRMESGYIVSPHALRRFGALANVDQSFLSAGIAFKLQGQYDVSDFYSSINGQLDAGVGQIGLVELTTVFDRWSWMTLENKTQYVYTQSRRRNGGAFASETVTNSLSLNVVPSKKWSASADYSVVALPREAGRYPTMHLLGGSLKYKLSPKLRLEGQFSNLLGQDEYIMRSVSSTHEGFSATSLSPFRILLTMKFDFN